MSSKMKRKHVSSCRKYLLNIIYMSWSVGHTDEVLNIAMISVSSYLLVEGTKLKYINSTEEDTLSLKWGIVDEIWIT